VTQQASSRRLAAAIAVALLLPGLAPGQVPAPADSLATVPADSALAEPAPEPVPDFFDTGISGTAAVMMTPVMPGWGQLYADNGWRAMLSFGAQWFFWSNMLKADTTGRSRYDGLADESWEIMRDYAWWSGAVLLIAALDAYVGAGLYNFDEEPIPVPTRFDEYFDTGAPEPPGSRGAPLLIVWHWSHGF